MSQPPFVTILLSIHNGADTLDRCFESIQKQTYPAFHILSVDDRSTDTTPQLLKKWQEIFGTDRLSILANEQNLGLTKSLNRGLEAITTPYTARIDADDWWHPEKLQYQIEFLESHSDHGIVGTAYTNVTYGKEKSVFPPFTDEAIRKDMFRRNPFAHSTVMFRTQLIKQVGGYDAAIRYGQDYELWLRISSLTRFANLKKILCYRASDSGISYTKQNAQMWQYIKTQFRYLRLLKRPISDYRYLIIPLLTILTPESIRRLKRKLL